MTQTDWLIVIAGGVIWVTLLEIARGLERLHRKLEIIVDELAFANRDKREIERRERYPNLPY